MKKYALALLAAVMLSFTAPVKSENVVVKNVKATKKFTPILRFYGDDNSGLYTVYVYAEPTFYGSICCGNASINIVEKSTSLPYTPFAQTGIMADDSGFEYVSGHAKINVNGATVQVFFDL